MAILHIMRQAFDDPDIACHLATPAVQADHLLLAHARLHLDHSLLSTSRPFAQKRLASRIFRPVSDKRHHYEPGMPLRVPSHNQIRPVYEECANVSRNSMEPRSVQSNAARQDAGGLFLRFLETVGHHASRVQNDCIAMSVLTKKYGTNVVVGRVVCMKWTCTSEHGWRRRARR